MGAWDDAEPAPPAPEPERAKQPATRNVAPHNLEAERSVLGGILIRPEVMRTVAWLEVMDFYLPAHRVIYEAMLAISARARPVDPVELEDAMRAADTLRSLPGGSSMFTELAAGGPTAENIEHYATIVKEKSALRKLIGACAEVGARAYAAEDGAAAVLAEARQSIVQVTNGVIGREAMPQIADQVAAHLEVIERRQSDPGAIEGIPSGDRRLDAYIRGFKPEQLIVPAARTSIGKSAWMLQVLSNAAIEFNVPTLFLSVEDPEVKLMDRLLCRIARLPKDAIEEGRIDAKDWRLIQAAGTKLARAPFTLDRVSTLEEVYAKAWRWRLKNQNAYVAIGVDYLQKLGVAPVKGEPRHERVGRICAGLKALGGKKELNCTIFSPSQVGRGVEKEDREPDLADLRESGNIEQDADIVIFLHRERFARSCDVALTVAKNKDGRTGKIKAWWEGQYQSFDALDGDDERKAREPGPPPTTWHDAQD